MLTTLCALWMSLLRKCLFKQNNSILQTLVPLYIIILYRLASPIIPEDWKKDCGITSNASGPNTSMIGMFDYRKEGVRKYIILLSCEYCGMNLLMIETATNKATRNTTEICHSQFLLV